MAAAEEVEVVMVAVATEVVAEAMAAIGEVVDMEAGEVLSSTCRCY